MLSKTTIYITIHQSETLMFTFHPQMTAQELQELIKASNFLSSKVCHSTSNTQSLSFLLSQSRNLITDYLLTSTTYPLSKICVIQQKYALFYRSLYEMKSSHLLQKYNNNQKVEQKAPVLNLQIISQQNQRQNQTTLICYQSLNDKKKCLTQEFDEKIMKFQTDIMISKENNMFRLRIKLRKQTLKTYHDFQNLMKIRQKLIELTKNSSNVFQQLINTCQDKQNLIFQLNYVPAIRITEILKYNIQKQYKKRIIEKVIAFMYCLICNGFQKYLYKLFQQTKLATILDEISIDFKENLRISDLRIILEHDEKSQLKMKKEELKNLQMHIQTYLYTLHAFNIQAQGIVTAEEVFIRLFSSQFYKFKLVAQENYSSECKFFLWKASQFLKNSIPFINEGITTKKKTVQDPPKKRIKSQKTKAKYGMLSYGREDKSTRKQNRSFV